MAHLRPLLVLGSLCAASSTSTACGGAELIGQSGETGDLDGPSTGEAPADTEPGTAGFVAHYLSVWTNPSMHFDDGSGWTAAPGVAMSADPDHDGWFTHEHPVGSGTVSFAFNDGGEMWDNNGGSNYTTELAEFWVAGGVVYDQMPDEGGDTTDVPFCEDVDCGSGDCNEASQTCDCDAGFLFDATAQTCVPDMCASVECGFGELCDPDDGSCIEACDPDRSSGEFSFCYQTTSSSVAVLARYEGRGSLDLDASEVRLNTTVLGGADIAFDADTQRVAVTAASLPGSKYSYLFRMKTDNGGDVQPLFVPTWVGDGIRFADFTWKDSILYQIMTDRFLDADPSNNIDNSQGSLAEVDDERSQWAGGDFAGIIEKIDDGYFADMGINTLWISSPLLNSHNSQPAVSASDNRRFSSYHSYHPIVTGYTHLDDYGYDNPIETAFGTPDELHELVEKAHLQGMRVIPDFVTNHVQDEANIYADHPEWFFAYNPCDGNWDEHRIDCWFTTAMPDFDYSDADARDAVVDHAIWLIEEFNFDGFRADALKHMDDAFVRALKVAVVEQIETTVDDHSMTEEATVFYMVGESLGGWARYHVREDMVQGQVDEEYYTQTKAALLSYNNSIRDLANFAIPNDTAYLSPEQIFGQLAGYPGAVMGNFFGNHDQWRALTEAGGDHDRLRLAQTFLFTSPVNIPMLYQGDDIGTFGEADPDNRAMHRFSGLSGPEAASLLNAQRLGKVREAHPALRRGVRQTEVLEDFFWVYKVAYDQGGEQDEVYVAINRDAARTWDPPAGFTDVLGNCNAGTVPSARSCVFVEAR